MPENRRVIRGRVVVVVHRVLARNEAAIACPLLEAADAARELPRGGRDLREDDRQAIEPRFDEEVQEHPRERAAHELVDR